jgi:hypothetical protein
MSMRQHPSFQSRARRTGTAAAEQPVAAEPQAVYQPTRRHSGRACCCPAQPAVIVMMPPIAARPTETELLLCGHHFRASQLALAAAGAMILDIRGYPLTAGAWPGPA